jgi:hypothetical protein
MTAIFVMSVPAFEGNVSDNRGWKFASFSPTDAGFQGANTRVGWVGG